MVAASPEFSSDFTNWICSTLPHERRCPTNMRCVMNARTGNSASKTSRVYLSPGATRKFLLIADGSPPAVAVAVTVARILLCWEKSPTTAWISAGLPFFFPNQDGGAPVTQPTRPNTWPPSKRSQRRWLSPAAEKSQASRVLRPHAPAVPLERRRGYGFEPRIRKAWYQPVLSKRGGILKRALEELFLYHPTDGPW